MCIPNVLCDLRACCVTDAASFPCALEYGLIGLQ